MKPSLLILILILLNSYISHAQDSTHYYINIITNNPNAPVYIDSTNAGTTPLNNYKLSNGFHTIKIINPANLNKTSWENENIEFKNFELISDTTIITSFKTLYLINTDPFNASVFKSDSLLGYTPLRFFSEGLLNWDLDLKKTGFKSKRINLSDYSGSPVNIYEKLSPENNFQENIIYKDKSTSFAKKRNVPLLTALGLGTLGGAFATINLKTKANNFYDSYLDNLNQVDLNNSNRYDTYSLISLILTQVALGAVIYFLFFD